MDNATRTVAAAAAAPANAAASDICERREPHIFYTHARVPVASTSVNLRLIELRWPIRMSMSIYYPLTV
jgi:hypothetical protein